MASQQRFQFFKEKLILLEEEKRLKDMLDKFRDQLNRLQIEELALLSMIKMDKEKKERGVNMNSPHPSSSSRGPGSDSSQTVTSLGSQAQIIKEEFVATDINVESADVINQQSLDLSLDGDWLTAQATSGSVSSSLGLSTVPKQEEEEEEEEEEMESEGDEDREEEGGIESTRKTLAEQTHQLMSFMDDF